MNRTGGDVTVYALRSLDADRHGRHGQWPEPGVWTDRVANPAAGAAARAARKAAREAAREAAWAARKAAREAAREAARATAREAARAAALEAWDAERAWQAGRLAEMLGVPTDLTGVTP